MSDRLLERRRRIAAARLYLICGARPRAGSLEQVLRAALTGGVDVVQLREKRLDDRELTPIAKAAGRLCAAFGALFIVNDRPALAAAVGADGVHIGQDDMPASAARAAVGEGLLVGLSTHAPAEIDAVGGEVDYIGVGPVYSTPTKPGRAAVGPELVRYAAAHASVPFFAIGGIGETTLAAVLAAGASRVAVVRAIADAADPLRAARALRRLLDERNGGAVEDGRLERSDDSGRAATAA